VDIRDLWSDELVAYAGHREDGVVIRMLRALEGWGYRSAALVTATTRALVETVVDRGAARERTVFLPNGADLETFKPLPRENPLADSLGLGDRFVVMYSGLFGIKHGLETLLEAAKILRDRDDIAFVLVGNGARRNALKSFVRANSLENVHLVDEKPVGDIPYLLARADLCFASCRPEPYPRKLISVKIFEYLASEKPVVGAFGGESAKIVEESGGGIVVPPGDHVRLADAIVEFYGKPQVRREMGQSGRKYIEQNFSRTDWAMKFEDHVRGLFAESEVPAGAGQHAES
jgi:glycosyltransferase involved in cell wall biosynthesis